MGRSPRASRHRPGAGGPEALRIVELPDLVPGAGEIVVAVHAAGVNRADVLEGDAVCAVLAGGGYADQALVPASTAMSLPPGLDLTAAAAVPEVFATAWGQPRQPG